jgi:hypothetical protein
MWSDTDLTEIPVNSVPALIESALDAYTDGSGEHVNFIGTDQHVHELYNGQFSSSKWTDNDLTHAANDTVLPVRWTRSLRQRSSISKVQNPAVVWG